MIEVVVADISAETRTNIAERIGHFQKSLIVEDPACPQISLKLLSMQELRFASSPLMDSFDVFHGKKIHVELHRIRMCG